VDLVIFIPTLTVAFISRSLLLFSDGIDFFRSFAVFGTSLYILRRIRKGQTTNYDYGAGKLECLGSLFGAGIIISGLLVLGVIAILRCRHGVALDAGFTSVGMLVQAVGIVVNGFFWHRNKRLAHETRAPLIEMQWRHNRTDTLAGGAVVTALALIVIFHHSAWSVYIDQVCTLGYVVYAISLYIPVVRDSLYEMLDRTLEEHLQIKILRCLAEHFDEYEAFHGVRSRRAGGRIFIELNLSFNDESSVGNVVATISEIRQRLESDIPRSEVIISIESPQK